MIFRDLYGGEATQFSSVYQLCPTLCGPMNCSMPGLPVHHLMKCPFVNLLTELMVQSKNHHRGGSFIKQVL